ncbi:NADPH-dependent diflavin oxidoreductase 1 isoform X1 [Chlorella sorokiniana]|uniref:NADPH-dependent diflavin oxidoreductase 1 n=1 Tax=Chlorella sorokiniana TaxID=3076 RepID=A0A2P6TBQ9_CHLSO|nr:NADPH-dependent diflavin oxidoreductase 1 isoform X1 [Chlorella sorokiniana]|eukprot:PRW18319.1 NADPH-dependent diflavin oxidoreductase 1 isoform X1 [Chlorella sorokiniana]
MAPPYPLLVLYGSQTGNAQDVAERVAREAARRHFAPRVLPADAYLPMVAHLPAEPALVWVASTTGQGDPPDNMRQLWRFLLRKSLAPGSLGSLRAAVFGLGDSGYPKYNVTAKKLFRRLEALGAHMLLPVGLGDDQHRSGYEAALDPWLAQLWPALRAAFPLPAGLTEPAPTDTATELVSKYRVAWLSGQEAAAAQQAAEQASGVADGTRCAWAAHAEALAAAAQFDRVEAAASGLPLPLQQQGAEGQPSARAAGGPATTAGHGAGGTGYGPHHPYWARLTANKRITAPAHFQDVRLLDVDLGQSGISYEPGDVLAVVPQQPAAAVEALCRRCGWDPHAWVRVEAVLAPAAAAAGEAASPAEAAQGSASSGAVASACSCTVRLGALIAGALDVNGASPRRFFFQVLHQYVRGSELEEERLAYFSSPEGRDNLYEYNQREGRTVLEVLGDFKSARLPLEWLLQACPRLKPRYFSIASSLAAHPHTAQLAVAIVDWATPFKRRRRGVCTSWLAALDPEAQGEVRLPVWLERGALRLPPSPAAPLLMVGPGTGVAPFRSFLQQRQAALLAGEVPRPAPCTLFFGCRNEAGDYYFREEWETMQAQDVLAPPPGGLVTAFSRDGPAKVYVQHRIRERAAEVWAALQAGAYVYVAGSADKMPAAVAAAIEEVVAQQGGMARDEAAAYVRHLELGGRYQVEAWS